MDTRQKDLDSRRLKASKMNTKKKIDKENNNDQIWVEKYVGKSYIRSIKMIQKEK